jgi:hypothetical protein
MWYRFANAIAIILSNPVPGGFWVGDRFIDYGEPFKLTELAKLLQTHPSNIRTQEKLNSFLSNSDRFEIIDGNKIYLRSSRGRNKSLIIPFDFYIGKDKIQKGDTYVADSLIKLLQSDYKHVKTQETLNSFLSNPDRFEIIDGKKIYLKNTTKKSKNLIIPFEFYIGEEKIQKDKVFGVKKLAKLLLNLELMKMAIINIFHSNDH